MTETRNRLLREADRLQHINYMARRTYLLGAGTSVVLGLLLWWLFGERGVMWPFGALALFFAALAAWNEHMIRRLREIGAK